MSEPREPKTALITGASSGIGLELARLFAADGWRLALVARSTDKLKELEREFLNAFKTETRVISADLGRPAGAREVVAALDGAPVDALVNTAGYGLYGAFSETPADKELGMIQLNVVALTELTKLLLPAMIARGSGRVLNVASTAAFQPGPLMAVYYATKAYVLSFSEAIAEELASTGVTVTALCPGPTKTGFQAGAAMEDSKLVRGREIMDSKTVARAGYAAMMKGKRVVIPGAMNKVLAQSVRFLPRSTVTRAVKRAQERAEH